MPDNHPPEIYQQNHRGNFVTPFNLEGSPTERLLLINFEHDPDEVYVGLEPQVFDHPSTGSGLLVIAYRKDGKIDIYHFLAPCPGDSEKPPSLPLVLLYSFYFVRKANPDLEIKIGGISHRLDSLPIPMDGAWMYFTRYASELFILNWNKVFEGALEPKCPSAPGEFSYQQVIYDLIDNCGYLEIGCMRPENAKLDVQIYIDPPIPNLIGFRDGAEAKGKFSIWMEESLGKIDGVYKLLRRAEQLEIDLHPNGGWQPWVKKWSLWFIFRVTLIFKNWPKIYRWTARIDLSHQDSPCMKSCWDRI
jgi:hypothetical protein